MAVTPYEVIVHPFDVYVAAVGTAFPLVDGSLSAWTQLGTSGSKSFSEDGVVVTHTQTIDYHRAYGDTAPIKATRSTEDMTVGFTLIDLTMAHYNRIWENTLTSTAQSSGVAGIKDIPIKKGLDVGVIAMIIRGASPYGDAWNTQYQIPKVVQSGSPAITFSKSAPAGLSLEYTVLADLTASPASIAMGKLIMQYQAQG